MDCKIRWKTMGRDEWVECLNRCPHTTLLQSYYYAQTMREVHQQGTRHGLILLDGEEAGIVQMQEVSLFKGLVHGMSIDRGPLWFEGFGKPSHLNAFSQALNWSFPDRWGRKRRFMPEVFDKKHLILFNNWKKMGNKKRYHTFLVDLTPEIEDIRANLKQKWRNVLNKAEKNKIKTEKDTKLATLSSFLDTYIKDRMQKGYAGASPKFLASLAKHSAMQNDCFIINAVEHEKVIASVLIFVHGKGATYQAGWTTQFGRDMGASNLLLWEAMIYLKKKGVTHFDLGGYNDETDGLKKFKEGLGGHAIALIGSYC